MWNAVRSAIDAGLQGQASRLMNLATDYKDRAVQQARAQAIALAVTAALAVVGLVFALIAVLIGLAALYHEVALMHGPLYGFAAAGGSALLLALMMFIIVAMRATASPKPAAQGEFNRIKSEATDALRKTERAAATLGTRAQNDAVALGKQTVDAATGIVRDGSREAVLATLAATVVIGMLLGRRR